MHITGMAGPGQVVLEIVFLSSTYANIRDVRILIDVADQRDPSLARGRTVDVLVQPAILYASDHGKREHAGG